MPAKVRVVGPLAPIEVPDRVGRQLLPEIERVEVPARVTLAGEPLYAGEEREGQYSNLKIALQPAGLVVIATLRRSWPLVGFLVNPGNAAAPGLVAALRVLGRGLSGTVAQVTVPPGATSAFVGFLVGCRCELVLVNAGATPASGVAGEIWGSPTK